MQSIAVQIIALTDSRRSHDAFQSAADAFIEFRSSPRSRSLLGKKHSSRFWKSEDHHVFLVTHGNFVNIRFELQGGKLRPSSASK